MMIKKIDRGKGENYLYFTQEGLDKIKKFVDNNYQLPVGNNNATKPLSEITIDNDIAWSDGQHKLGRNALGEALEVSKIIQQGKFVSQETFEFMVWAMGDQEVEVMDRELLKDHIKKLIKVRGEANSFFDQDWKEFQQKEEKLINWVARLVFKISPPVSKFISEIEILDEQKKEKLTNLDANYQNLKEIYDELRAEGLTLPESIDETSLSDSSQLINGLKENIINNTEQTEINKKSSDLEGIWKEKVKVNLNEAIETVQTEIGQEEVEINNQETQAVILQSE